ncbi:hypothetical protein GGS21DRAFT_488233 [Xylaria nigripes]|nr:hypothetical protein GGS21DRAFT_488233 [Xylaria nigripes]
MKPLQHLLPANLERGKTWSANMANVLEHLQLPGTIFGIRQQLAKWDYPSFRLPMHIWWAASSEYNPTACSHSTRKARAVTGSPTVRKRVPTCPPGHTKPTTEWETLSTSGKLIIDITGSLMEMYPDGAGLAVTGDLAPSESSEEKFEVSNFSRPNSLLINHTSRNLNKADNARSKASKASKASEATDETHRRIKHTLQFDTVRMELDYADKWDLAHLHCTVSVSSRHDEEANLRASYMDMAQAVIKAEGTVPNYGEACPDLVLPTEEDSEESADE